MYTHNRAHMGPLVSSASYPVVNSLGWEPTRLGAHTAQLSTSRSFIGQETEVSTKRPIESSEVLLLTVMTIGLAIGGFLIVKDLEKG